LLAEELPGEAWLRRAEECAHYGLGVELGDDHLQAHGGRAELSGAEGDVDAGVAVEGDHALERLDAEGRVATRDLDGVLELDGRGGAHAEGLGERGAERQLREGVIGGEVVGGDDRVGVERHEKVLLALVTLEAKLMLV